MENIELDLFILAFMCLSNSRLELLHQMNVFLFIYISEFMDGFFFVECI